ncbi:MAG: Mur ligase family protein, partial [Thermoflexibacteraceae bacterium]
MLTLLYPIADSYNLLADKQLVTDSRQVLMPSQSVFFALKGRQDGHQYISSLYQQGVHYFVVNATTYEHSDWEKNCPEAHFFLCEDVLAGLQFLVAYHRRNFKIPIIAITGSNGKTIIKEWLGQLLSHEYKVVKSPKSYNSQIGVPLSVWQLQEQHEVGIFEAGISTMGEMQALQSIIKPTIGIFTNIGQAHDEGFSSRAEKIKEKLALFTHCKLLIYNSDYRQIEDELLQWQTQYPDVTVFSWGYSPLADLQIKACHVLGKKTEIIVFFKEIENKIIVPFTEKAFVENSLHCVALLLILGWEWTKITAHLQDLKPIQMRLELKQGSNNCLLIDDTYNNDLAGLMVALNFLNQHQQKSSNTVILSDMYESGLPAEQLYEQIA